MLRTTERVDWRPAVGADRVFRTAAILARNVALGANVVSLTLVARPRKLIEYVTENLFLFNVLTSGRGLPERNVYQVLPSHDHEVVTLGNLKDPRDRSYLFSIASFASDIVSLCLICQILKPKVVFEIGTMEGYTALHFALNTPDDARIYTLDLPKGRPAALKLKTTAKDDEGIEVSTAQGKYLFDRTQVAPKITCLFGDSATFDYARFQGVIDLFFIDGAHSYEYVRSDTLSALKCCHPGSVIAWHDFGRVGLNGVSKWLLELSRDHEIFSVPGGSLAYMVVK